MTNTELIFEVIKIFFLLGIMWNLVDINNGIYILNQKNNRD